METRKNAAEGGGGEQADRVHLPFEMGQQSLEKSSKPQSPQGRAETLFEDAFGIGVSKIRRNLPALVAEPGSWGYDVRGDYANRAEGFHEIGNWTTSFFTGMALLANLKSRDEELIDLVEGLDASYQKKLENHAVETMHDLGFLYSLYSVALHRLTGKAVHRDTGLRAAEVLAGRFVPEGDYFRAWGPVAERDTEYGGLAIIDSLMNMPLLYWASDESGDDRFRDMAVRHTNTTLSHFIREDDSVFHAFRFDPESGKPLGGENYCGRSIQSHWARGTTWAMYGFSLGYKHTGDGRYLDAAIALTDKYMSLLDDEKVPVWDFRLGDDEGLVRDSSSAAVAVCAIQSLMSLTEVSFEVRECKNQLLLALCSDAYLDRSSSCRGLLKQGQVGAGLGKAKNAYTSWGDYFFMQALATELGLASDWW